MALVFFGCDGMANALLPRFVVDKLGGSETTVGIVVSAAGVTALLFRPWIGRLADLRGARRLLIYGGLVTALGYLLLLALPTIDSAIFSRLLIGGGRAAVFVGTSLLAMQIAPQNRQTEAASYLLVAVHIGGGSGPLLGEAIRNQVSYDLAWQVIAMLAVFSSLIALLLPIRKIIHQDEPAPLIHRGSIPSGLVSFLGIFALNGLMVFVPLYGREIGLNDVGIVFAIISFTMVIMRLLLGRVPDIVGLIPTCSAALVITVIGACVLALWEEPAGLYIGAGLLAAGLSLQSPCLMAISLNGVKDREKGAAMATFSASFDIANSIAGPVFGLLISEFSYSVAFLTGGGMALLSFALLHLLVAPHHKALLKKNKGRPAPT